MIIFVEAVVVIPFKKVPVIEIEVVPTSIGLLSWTSIEGLTIEPIVEGKFVELYVKPDVPVQVGNDVNSVIGYDLNTPSQLYVESV